MFSKYQQIIFLKINLILEDLNITRLGSIFSEFALLNKNFTFINMENVYSFVSHLFNDNEYGNHAYCKCSKILNTCLPKRPRKTGQT